MSDKQTPVSVFGAAQYSRRPYFGIGLGLLAVSTASLFIRYAQSEGVPSLVIAAFRLGLASLVLAPFALWRQASELRAFTRRQWLLILTSGLFLSAHFAAWISSLAYTSVASSVVLVSTAPLFVAVIAGLALREKLSRPVVAGLILTLAGAVVVGLSAACPAPSCPARQSLLQGQSLVGDLLALVGGLALAVYLVVGRSLRASVSLTSYIFTTYATAALVLFLALALARLPLIGYSGQAYLWLTLLALVPQLVGHSSFNWALKYLPATFVSITLLGEPAGSIVLAAVLLGEVPRIVELGGSLLILFGIILAAAQPRANHV